MCSRYNLTSPPEAVRAYFGYADTPNFPARYNIAPTQPIAVVARGREGTRRFRLMRWGLLPSFVKDPKQFPTPDHARSEDVLVKASFRNAMRWRRCLVPADGFYDWTGEKGKRRPFLLRPREPHLIAFAGIYERWRDGKGDEIDTVAILTCLQIAPYRRCMTACRWYCRLSISQHGSTLKAPHRKKLPCCCSLPPTICSRPSRCTRRSMTSSATSRASWNRCNPPCFRSRR
jgi:hypothetical protein